MEIRDIDLNDDAQLHTAYAIEQRARRVGREQMPHWTREEFCGAMRTPDSGERQYMRAAYEGETMVGFSVTWHPLLDNTEKCWGEISVDPPVVRRGAGSALLDDIEATAAANDRTMVIIVSRVPADQRDTHPYSLFAQTRGYSLGNLEIVRHLSLPVPEERISGWIESAATAHEGYEIVTFADEFPEHLAESLCLLLGQLAADAPTGSIDFEEEVISPERLADRYATAAAMGRSIYETVALAPDGVVAAQSTLAVSKGESPHVFQWGTFVHREHRGHRLGLATKAANLLAVQRAHPDKNLVTTQNAEDNGYMVAINEQMGFEPVEAALEWCKTI
ncbi:hypothetical protein [Nocardioides sp.]|uniref:hypothetical protein n=1 Tax=Nocardioides sp. TaxID=35761 RepID=UPI00356A8C49